MAGPLCPSAHIINAVVEFLGEAGSGACDRVCDLAQLPSVHLPAHIDAHADEAVVKLIWLVGHLEAFRDRPADLLAAMYRCRLLSICFLPPLLLSLLVIAFNICALIFTALSTISLEDEVCRPTQRKPEGLYSALRGFTG